MLTDIIQKLLNGLTPLQMCVAIVGMIWLAIVGGISLMKLSENIFQHKNKR